MKMNDTSENILIVDDTLENLRLLSQMLTESGYKVRATKYGIEALESINASLPDLVLLDIKLPDISGYEVCKRLKSNEKTSSVPVLFLSALNDTNDKIRGFDAGGVDYITKPFRYEEVIVRVKTHLEINRLRKELEIKNKELQLINERLVIESNENKLTGETLKRKENLLTETEKLGKVGGWEFNIDTGEQTWTEEIYNIHEVDLSYEPTVEKGINFYTPASRIIIEKAVQKTIENGESYDVELEIITAKGNIRNVHAIGKSDPEHRRVYGFFQDITDRKQVEESLRETNEYLENLFNYANAPIIVWDPKFNITRFNPAFEFLTGRKAEEVIGGSIEILFPSDQVESSMELIRKAQQGERWETVEINILHVNSSVRTLLWNSASVLGADGKTIIATIAQGQDITERKTAEEKLRLLKEELEVSILNRTSELKDALELNRTVIDASSLGIFACREDGPCIIANSAVARISGAPVEKMLQLNFRNLDTWKKNGLFEKVEIALQTQAEQNAIVHLTTVFGRDSWIKYYITTFHSEGILHFLMVVEDITERKLAEIELEKYRKHLEELVNERTEELAYTIGNLERSNKELEQFAYVASHDLQEPLRMVSSYTQLLAKKYEGQLDDKAKKYINYAVDGAIRMQLLINDLLTYSRVTTQGKESEHTDSHSVLGKALQNLSVSIEENRAIVTNNDLPVVYVDPVQLLQVFQNLISNSIKFKGTALPHIHVSASDNGTEWLFSVKDNGIGIDLKYSKKLFVIFQRLHTKQEYPGTGIGLALCKRIVERHGGRIWFESEPGKGSIFYFTLPKGGE